MQKSQRTSLVTEAFDLSWRVCLTRLPPLRVGDPQAFFLNPALFLHVPTAAARENAQTMSPCIA